MSISDPVFALPKDVSLQFFLLLGENDLARCCQVSKAWNTFVSDDKVWEEKAITQWNRLPRTIKAMYCHETLSKENKKHVVKLLPKMLLSNNEIIYRIHRFINKVSLGQNGIFRCYVPSKEGRVQNILVEIRSDATNPKYDVCENCFTYTLAEGFLDHPVSINYSSRALERITLKYGYRFVTPVGWASPFQIDSRLMTYKSFATYFNNYRPYKIYLTFPVSSDANFNVRTMMEYKIEKIIKFKLDQLDEASYRQKAIMFTKTITSIPNTITTVLNSAFQDKKRNRLRNQTIVHKRIPSQ